MNLCSIFVSNGSGIAILLILRYASRTKTLRQHTEDKIYSFMVIGVLLACCMEAFSYALDGRVFTGARFLNYAANTYLYSVNLLLPFNLLIYVDLVLYDDKSRIWKCYKPQIIIGLVMLCVNIVNFFIPISYYITPQNVYERRPLSYVYYFVILYYCLTSLFQVKRYEKENGARAFFNMGIYLIPILIGAALQFMFYGLSLAWMSAAFGLVGLFMMQQNEMAYIDSLVETYNRQYLNNILSAWITRGHDFSGVMLDIDHFKAINDEFGHTEGDNALRTLADILKRSRKDHEWVFRFAGDEFIVLKINSAPDSLEAYMSEVERQLATFNRSGHPYRLSVSYGISAFNNDGIDAFMKEMDSKMYRMKAEHHEMSRETA